MMGFLSSSGSSPLGRSVCLRSPASGGGLCGWRAYIGILDTSLFLQKVPGIGRAWGDVVRHRPSLDRCFWVDAGRLSADFDPILTNLGPTSSELCQFWGDAGRNRPELRQTSAVSTKCSTLSISSAQVWSSAAMWAALEGLVMAEETTRTLSSSCSPLVLEKASRANPVSGELGQWRSCRIVAQHKLREREPQVRPLLVELGLELAKIEQI